MIQCMRMVNGGQNWHTIRTIATSIIQEHTQITNMNSQKTCSSKQREFCFSNMTESPKNTDRLFCNIDFWLHWPKRTIQYIHILIYLTFEKCSYIDENVTRHACSLSISFASSESSSMLGFCIVAPLELALCQARAFKATTLFVEITRIISCILSTDSVRETMNDLSSAATQMICEHGAGFTVRISFMLFNWIAGMRWAS